MQNESNGSEDEVKEELRVEKRGRRESAEGEGLDPRKGMMVEEHGGGKARSAIRIEGVRKRE